MVYHSFLIVMRFLGIMNEIYMRIIKYIVCLFGIALVGLAAFTSPCENQITNHPYTTIILSSIFIFGLLYLSDKEL